MHHHVSSLTLWTCRPSRSIARWNKDLISRQTPTETRIRLESQRPPWPDGETHGDLADGYPGSATAPSLAATDHLAESSFGRQCPAGFFGITCYRFGGRMTVPRLLTGRGASTAGTSRNSVPQGFPFSTDCNRPSASPGLEPHLPLLLFFSYIRQPIMPERIPHTPTLPT